MNKLLYIFLSLVFTFKSFPANISIWIMDYDQQGHLLQIGEEENECFELNNDILDDIKLNATDKDTVEQWCRNFAMEHINDFNKESLKYTFNCGYADNVEFLQIVFSDYTLVIVLTSTNTSIPRKTLTTYKEFINYINNVDGIQLQYRYLDIYFYDDKNVKNKIIEDISNRLDVAYKNKDIIINGIISVCNDYYENIRKSPIQENYSNNVSDELTNEINDFFLSHSYDQSNLTGMFSVNESLYNEIECIKSGYVKKCNEVIEIKLNEFNKMKAEKEKTKAKVSKTASTTGPITTTTTTGAKTATATTGTKTTSPITTTTATITTTTGTKTTTGTGVDNTYHVKGNKNGKTNTSNGCCISCRKNIN